MSRRSLPRRASTRTRRRTGWALGRGAAVPKVCRRRRAGRGACARRWRRVLCRPARRRPDNGAQVNARAGGALPARATAASSGAVVRAGSANAAAAAAAPAGADDSRRLGRRHFGGDVGERRGPRACWFGMSRPTKRRVRARDRRATRISAPAPAAPSGCRRLRRSAARDDPGARHRLGREAINVTSRVHYSVASSKNSKASARWQTTTAVARHRPRVRPDGATAGAGASAAGSRAQNAWSW